MHVYTLYQNCFFCRTWQSHVAKIQQMITIMLICSWRRSVVECALAVLRNQSCLGIFGPYWFWCLGKEKVIFGGEGKERVPLPLPLMIIMPIINRAITEQLLSSPCPFICLWQIYAFGTIKVSFEWSGVECHSQEYAAPYHIQFLFSFYDWHIRIKWCGDAIIS